MLLRLGVRIEEFPMLDVGLAEGLLAIQEWQEAVEKQRWDGIFQGIKLLLQK